MTTGTAGPVTRPGTSPRPTLRRRVPDIEPPYDDSANRDVRPTQPTSVDTTPRELGAGLTTPGPAGVLRRARLRHDSGHEPIRDRCSEQPAVGQPARVSTLAREAGRAVDGTDGRFHPVPRSAAAVVTRALLEVVCGQRPAAQLAGWTTPALQAELARVSGTVSVRRRYVVRSLRVSEPQPGVAEVVAVVARDDRMAAIALRMESSAGRWRVTRFEMG